ncbi:hypothetical protein KVR01_007479 [Diaporthe batatas]|uniref:uncharacterized protein n=1 Tax=Diaporthe batatas TaxID=748121 RepID=UPI001D05AA6C|nr:uncharacterized protein KVR01_007479 [Diaporthe batatas]KAG8163001.1 hypothetical protein KVR01_007479 [Diaporthe batatas]
MASLKSELASVEGLKDLEEVEVAENSEQPPAPESVASPYELPDVEFSVCEPGVLVEYFRGHVAAALAGDAAGRGNPRNITIRFTCPPHAAPTLALEELAGLMTRAGDTLRVELAAAAAAEEGGRKRRQADSVQPLAYRNRRPTPSAAAPKSTAEAACTQSHTMELSEAFAKLRHGPQKRSDP